MVGGEVVFEYKEVELIIKKRKMKCFMKCRMGVFTRRRLEKRLFDCSEIRILKTHFY
jgi:hypothetical protein